MTLFPIVRPRLGVSITTDSACLVEIQRKWSGKAFCQLAHQPLPDGLIQLSPTKPNIADPNTLSEVLVALAKGYRKPQPIALSLPDVCGRTALFEFNSFPKKRSDRKAILSWRFQQDINFSIQNARIGFRLYEPPTGKKTKPQGLTKVLATVVPNSIIEQYELACLKAGLLPLGVGLSSFDVFDLLMPKIQETAQKVSGRDPQTEPESLFLYLAGWGFSFIALREGCPAFVRVKSLRLLQRQEPQLQSDQPPLGDQIHETTSDINQSADSLTSHSHPEAKAQASPSTPGTAKMLTNELVATLQFYLESFQSTFWEGRTLRMYIAEGFEQGRTVLPAIQEIESMLKSSMVGSPQIDLIPFWDHLRNFPTTKDKLTPYTYPKALPAYASVMVSS